MSESDTSYGSVHGEGETDRDDSAPRSESSSGGRIRSLLTRGLKRGASSGALASLGGGALAVRGVRRFREGARLRGVLQTSLGGILVGLGVAQGRKAMTGTDGSESAADRGDGIDQTDVVDTAPDVEDVASTSGSESTIDRASGDEASSVVDTAPDVEDAAEPGERSTDHASGDEAAEVVDTGPDVEGATTEDDGAEAASGGADSTSETGGGEADTGAGQADTGGVDAETEGGEAGGGDAGTTAGDESETGDAEAEMESFDRLGTAAFDEDSRNLPAPQRAFNQEFLALGVEAVWGVREFDGVVVVSQFYDPIQDRTDLRYVTTSEVEDDRIVHVPDAVLDHWEDLLDGGVAVESGDDLVFATSEDLESDGLLAVVPAKWTTDLFGDEG